MVVMDDDESPEDIQQERVQSLGPKGVQASEMFG